jgi:hypothetical protein
VWSRKKLPGRGMAAGDKQKPLHMSPSHRRGRRGLGSDRTGAGGFAGILGPRPQQRDRALRSRDADGARRHCSVGCAEGASRHDAFTGPQGDADPDGTGNGTVGLSDERLSSPLDGLGGLAAQVPPALPLSVGAQRAASRVRWRRAAPRP